MSTERTDFAPGDFGVVRDEYIKITQLQIVSFYLPQ